MREIHEIIFSGLWKPWPSVIFIIFLTILLHAAAAAAAKSLQSCPTLCDPIDGLPPGSPVPGILQARTLEWVAISFSSAWNWKVKMKSPSRAQLLATPWTTTHQAPPSMGFSRQEYWSGVLLPSPCRIFNLNLCPLQWKSVQSLNHWTTREVLWVLFSSS